MTCMNYTSSKNSFAFSCYPMAPHQGDVEQLKRREAYESAWFARACVFWPPYVAQCNRPCLLPEELKSLAYLCDGMLIRWDTRLGGGSLLRPSLLGPSPRSSALQP